MSPWVSSPFSLFVLLVQEKSRQAQAVRGVYPDDRVWRYLVNLKYWTPNLRPLIVYPKVLFPPNFSVKGGIWVAAAGTPLGMSARWWQTFTGRSSYVACSLAAQSGPNSF